MLRAPAFAAFALTLVASPALANLPPIVVVNAAPIEVRVGDAVTLDAAGTTDPDNGPNALSYAWELGDGATATGPAATHAYATPGLKDITLRVSDSASESVGTARVAVLAPLAPGQATQSSPAAPGPGNTLLLVHEDANAIISVGLPGLQAVSERPACAAPQALAVEPGGARVVITCRDDNALLVMDGVTLVESARIRVGHRPHGVAWIPGTNSVLVANEGDDTVNVVDVDSQAVTGALPVREGPRALAVTHDGARAVVAQFLARGNGAVVSVLTLVPLAVVHEVVLVEDPGPDSPSSGKGYPNLLGTVAIDPGGRFAWVGGLKSNTGRGLLLSGFSLLPTNRVRGVMVRVDLDTGTEDPARRVDTNNADSVSAIGFSPSGRYAYVAHAGASAITVFDLLAVERHDPSDASPAPQEARVGVGDLPRAVIVAAEGETAWTWNTLGRTVTELELPTATTPRVARHAAVASEPLSTAVALGKRMFHDSRAPLHSTDNYVACASCHPGGGHDGRTWDFTQAGEGLRNTVDLRGRAGTGHGPVHWSANFDEIQDFENDIVNAFGGAGLAQDGMGPHAPLAGAPNAGRSAELDALAAYVASLGTHPRSPWRLADGGWSESALRGQRMFTDVRARCVECHVPPLLTDSSLARVDGGFILHDVGTLLPSSGGRLGGPLPGVDTPTLHGLWEGAPYLHDGRAATLREVLITHNNADQHGVTSGLSAAQVDDVVEFLLSLDGDWPWVTDAGVPDAGVDGGERDAGTQQGLPADAGVASPGRGEGGACACVQSQRGWDPTATLAISGVAWWVFQRRRAFPLM